MAQKVMKVPNQDELAWDLVDAARSSLDIPAINRVSMTIASGDHVAVVEILLRAAAFTALPLPDDLCVRIGEWLRYYSGHPDSTHLLTLLARTARVSGRQ